MAGKHFQRPEIHRHHRFQFIRASEEYTLSEYENLFGNTLPQMVMVAQGGRVGDMEFIKGQILTLQAISRQERLVGKAVRRKYNELYGIPTGTQNSFCAVNSEGKATGKEGSLYELLRHNKLPFRVQFPRGSVLRYDNKTISTNNVPHIDLTYMFIETHVLANFVVQDTVMEDILYIPFHDSSLRLATVVGINGMAGNIFRHFKETIDHMCLAYEYDLEYGKIDVAVYDAKELQGKKITRCTKPLKYTTFGEIFDRPFEEMQDVEEDNTYEAPEDLCENDDEYEELQDVRRRSTGPQVLQQTQQDTSVGSSAGFVKTIAKSLEGLQRPLPNPKSEFIPHSGATKEQRRNEDHKTSETVRMYTNDIPRGQVSPFVKTPATVDVLKLAGFTSDHVGEKDKLTTQHILSESKKEVSVKYATQRSVSEPTKEGGVSESVENPYKLNPVDVGKLSIDQVCDYLKILKLDNYSDLFREQMVDGEILQEINMTLLEDDFGFKKIEAIRLMKFVKDGHVPI